MGKSEKPAQMDLDSLSVNTIRTLAMDAVEKAGSGHPGAPMALAPIAYTLWTRFLRHNPKNPNWFDRDRFVLSNGHASMLQYAMLYLTGYDLELEDLKNFRQWGSRTPGHPERGLTPGIETTTGPLGQGVMNSVGMAMAEAHMAALFNRPGHTIVDHYTYAFCSDGDFMEGASHEAASLAGHLGLGKLIWIYDDNHISIEGPTELACSDDVAKRFEAYNWHVQDIGDAAEDIEAIAAAISAARDETSRPSLIIVRTHIGYGAPNLQDTARAHGSPLGGQEVAAAKENYGWPKDAQFLVPDRALEHMRKAVERGAKYEAEWNEAFEAYKKAHPESAAAFQAALSQELPEGWDADIPVFSPSDKPIATRSAGGKILNAVAERVPWLAGGSADLSPSTKTLIDSSDYFEKGRYANRNFAFGVREHVMCAASSGMYLHGGVRPYAATFFVFTDYARPAIRLAALMKTPVIYVMTHDSIAIGEDGPTHQPVEHLASLRAMPNVCLIRPCDANETAFAWRAAMLRTDGPTILVLTRQNLPILDREKYAAAGGLMRGAYVLSPEKGEKPEIVLIASGSEVHLALESQTALAESDIDARVVSMPSWEIFREQDEAYRNEVLPPEVRARLAIEAGAALGWREWVGDAGGVIAMSTFGASAPGKVATAKFGFNVENIVARSKEILAS